MKPSPRRLLILLGSMFAAGWCGSASAATTWMINFSSATGNDITSGQATALGLEPGTYQNVRTSASGANGGTGINTTISLAEIGGTATWQSWYQLNQLTNLGQPYATFIGGGYQIGSTGQQVIVNLTGLDSWMAANNFTSYEVILHYAGRSDVSKSLVTTDNIVSFTTSAGTIYDDITVTGQGTGSPALWKGVGTTQTFNTAQLGISVGYIAGGNDTDRAAGLAAIQIIGVPEPGLAMLGCLSLTGLLRRRR